MSDTAIERINAAITAEQAARDQVWALRREINADWPTPNTGDAILFAFTEAGEAVDAYLRSQPRYQRNHAKPADELGEWADCLMMLCTATGPSLVESAETMPWYWLDDADVTIVGNLIGDMLWDMQAADLYASETWQAAVALLYLRPEVAARLPERLAAIREKALARRYERLLAENFDEGEQDDDDVCTICSSCKDICRTAADCLVDDVRSEFEPAPEKLDVLTFILDNDLSLSGVSNIVDAWREGKKAVAA